MFVHTSALLTFDFGASYDGANTIYTADEHLALTRRTIEDEYVLGARCW